MNTQFSILFWPFFKLYKICSKKISTCRLILCILKLPLTTKTLGQVAASYEIISLKTTGSTAPSLLLMITPYGQFPLTKKRRLANACPPTIIKDISSFFAIHFCLSRNFDLKCRAQNLNGIRKDQDPQNFKSNVFFLNNYFTTLKKQGSHCQQ